MAYLKRWAARAANPLELREPEPVAGPAGDGHLRATPTSSRPRSPGSTCAYVDPPYNQHSYLGNYHVWETLVRGDRPEHYGVACKRADCRTRKSAYNSRRAAWTALDDLIEPAGDAVARRVGLGRGLPRPGRRRASGCAERGHVGALHVDFKRYVGAQIGIHNPAGERVGRSRTCATRSGCSCAAPTGRRSRIGSARVASGEDNGIGEPPRRLPRLIVIDCGGVAR